MDNPLANKAIYYLLKNNYFSNEEIILSGGGSEYFEYMVLTKYSYPDFRLDRPAGQGCAEVVPDTS